MDDYQKLTKAIREITDNTKLSAEEIYTMIDMINKQIYYDRINS